MNGFVPLPPEYQFIHDKCDCAADNYKYKAERYKRGNVIGEVFFGRRSILLCLISAVVGSVVYRIIIALALQLDLFDANALKLISAVIVAVTLAVPAFKTRFQNWRTRREAGKHA